LERRAISKEISQQLAKVLRSDQYLLTCAEQATGIALEQEKLEKVTDETLITGLSRFRAEVVKLFEIANPETAGFSMAECELQLDQVQVAFDDIKVELLLAGVELRIEIATMIDVLEQNTRIRRMSRQMVKALRYLVELSMVAEVKGANTEQVPEVARVEPTEIDERQTERVSDLSEGDFKTSEV
jgi:hypothetical protein